MTHTSARIPLRSAEGSPTADPNTVLKSVRTKSDQSALASGGLRKRLIATPRRESSTVAPRQQQLPHSAVSFQRVQESFEEAIISRTLTSLGISSLFKRKPPNQAEIHAAVVDGIPFAALFLLTEGCSEVREEDVAHVLGVSSRTLRRQKDAPEKLMPPDLGSKTYLFAETLARAEDLLGTKQDAERWIMEKAMGLDNARPIDLLRTAQGANLVTQFLKRLKYGVYS